MSVSIVVVLHDSGADLERLVASLRSHAPDGGHQLICVDSGSTDRGAGAAIARAAGAEVIELADNAGFGAANNAGVQRATRPVTILMNPDVELLDGGAIGALCALATTRDALHVPRLLNTDGTVQDSAHPLPGSIGHALLAIAHPPLLPRPLREAAAPWRATADRQVGWAIAACVAARTATLRRLGPFDPAQFLFYEDLDLALRARRAAIPTILHPGIALRHRGAHSTGPAYGGEPYALLARRRRAVIAANLGRTGLARDDLLEGLTFATRAAAARVARRPGGEAAARLSALRAARGAGVQNNPS